MTYPPGCLPAAALTTVQGDLQLATGTARAWAGLQTDAWKQLRRRIAIAAKAGAYRSAWMQHQMHLAGAGHDRAAKIRWNLNPGSVVAIADHPLGTHEDGRAVDVVGTPMDAAFLALAARWGFRLQFPGRDPNHLRHDGVTGIKPTVTAAVRGLKKTVTYRVQDGDTLAAIARKYSDPRTKKADLTVADLLHLNPAIRNPNRIRVGQKIRVA